MGKNNVVRVIRQGSVFPEAAALVNSSISFEQGDLMYFDTGTIRKQTTGDTGASFLGIAPVTVVSGLEKRPYTTDVDASGADGAIPGPVFGDVVKLVAKTGDAFTVGCKVYPDPATGTRGISTTAGSLVAIGVYQGKAITAAAAGQEVEVLLAQTYLAGI
jgi:hypothetical protein